MAGVAPPVPPHSLVASANNRQLLSYGRKMHVDDTVKLKTAKGGKEFNGVNCSPHPTTTKPPPPPSSTLANNVCTHHRCTIKSGPNERLGRGGGAMIPQHVCTYNSQSRKQMH